MSAQPDQTIPLFPATITPAQLEILRQQPDIILLDVRTPAEYQQLGHIPEAQLLPIQILDQQVHTLDATAPTVVICEHGVRSTHACQWLQQQGFTHLYNLAEGMSGWTGERTGN